MITKPIVIVVVVIIIAALAYKYRGKIMAKWNDVAM